MATDDLGAFVGNLGVLAEGRGSGPLAGLTLGVKDLFDVAGTVTGAGNPTFAAERPPATRHAAAVQRLVDAGATVIGKTLTDELAFSLSGTNVHFGTPVNPAAPGHVPGGSSAGSAAAVAGGLVDLALGTDTAGSIRVPASYCGIVGWRSTHGTIPMDGVVALAPSFDTVGLFARDAGALLTAAGALLAASPSASGELGVPRLLVEAFDDVGADVADALREAAGRSGIDPSRTVELGIPLETALAAQRTRQTREAWLTHGPWITTARPDLGPGIRTRFEAGSRVTAADVDAVAPVAEAVRGRVHELLADGPLVVPAAAGPPPSIDAATDRAEDETRRASTLRLTCVAGLAGAPVVVVPGASVDGLPVGLALIGPRHSDLALIAVGARLAVSAAGAWGS